MSRHPLDPVSLVAGLVFASVAGVYLLAANSTWDVDARWVLPLMLIGLGLGGVAGALTTASRQRRDAAAHVTPEGVDEQAERSE